MNNIENIYFVGIGGIGMSAIARHFNAIGKRVAGYDRTPTELTNEIMSEGIDITFEDDIKTIPQTFKDKSKTIVVITPAIPTDNAIRRFFEDGDFVVTKRAEMLGKLTSMSSAICIAGTHGKTTTSTMVAHVMRSSSIGCSAFLGGVSANYNTNYWSDTTSSFVVTEADEYDRSFLHLHPYLSLITAMDADHLDIYGTHKEVKKAFHQFASQTEIGGAVVYKHELEFDEEKVDEDCEIFTYSLKNKEADFYAFDIKLQGAHSFFSMQTPFGVIKGVELGIPGYHNVENAVAASALSLIAGVTADELKQALKEFKGNRRRFQYRIDEPDFCLIDDYAHHPEEIRSMLVSLRQMYKERKITVVFQPHLYTRTRDFADEFAEVLSLADRILLLDIYPARELPIEGVTSEMLLSKICKANASLTSNKKLFEDIMKCPLDVLVMMGAGNIDAMVGQIEKEIRNVKS